MTIYKGAPLDYPYIPSARRVLYIGTGTTFGSGWVRNSTNAAGDATDQVLVSIPITGNIISPNGIILLQTFWTFTNSANTKNVKATFSTGANLIANGFTTNTSACISRYANLNNAMNSLKVQQINGLSGTASSNPVVTGDNLGANFTLDLKCSWGAATLGETITLEYVCVEIAG